ncbi:MAG: biotin--[acetyl-CoA-carboxylase] ligase [Bordetella sp. SCN 68-11]|nr:MAG: biotin--[acetyl-CoA-carboxylase] ligase [Bordetella sp. SCN 68-11]
MQDRKLCPEAIRSLLDRDQSIHLEVYDRIDSTNTRAKELAQRGMTEITAIAADCQTAGRGRMGRSFFSPSGCGLYLSVLFRPTLPRERFSQITPFAAVAAATAIERLCGAPVGIKWVNDLQMNGKKIAGILTETQLSTHGGSDTVVLGIGVNVCYTEWPEELSPIACSIEEACGVPLSRNALAAALINAFSPLFRGELPDYLPEYRARSVLLGRQVTVYQGTTQFDGLACAIDDDAALIVALSEGTHRTIRAGEVSVRPV